MIYGSGIYGSVSYGGIVGSTEAGPAGPPKFIPEQIGLHPLEGLFVLLIFLEIGLVG